MQLVGLGDEQRPYALTHAPISVIPVPFPRASFDKAREAMQVFNKVIDRVSRDGDYLQTTLRPAAEFDDFTARFLFGSILSAQLPDLIHVLTAHVGPRG
jgi:glutathione synthase